MRAGTGADVGRAHTSANGGETVVVGKGVKPAESKAFNGTGAEPGAFGHAVVPPAWATREYAGGSRERRGKYTVSSHFPDWMWVGS